MTDLSTAIVALATLMTLVALVPRLASVVRLPATVLLGVLGCVLGLAMSTASADHAASDLFSMVLAGLRGLPLNSEIILWVFLPIMLFEVAIGLDDRSCWKRPAAFWSWPSSPCSSPPWSPVCWSLV